VIRTEVDLAVTQETNETFFAFDRAPIFLLERIDEGDPSKVDLGDRLRRAVAFRELPPLADEGFGIEPLGDRELHVRDDGTNGNDLVSAVGQSSTLRHQITLAQFLELLGGHTIPTTRELHVTRQSDVERFHGSAHCRSPVLRRCSYYRMNFVAICASYRHGSHSHKIICFQTILWLWLLAFKGANYITHYTPVQHVCQAISASKYGSKYAQFCILDYYH